MNEYLARFHLEPDDGYAGGVALDRTAVVRSAVSMERRRSAMVRRGPRRTIKKSADVFSTYGIGWNFDINDDLPSMQMALEAMCDRGSMAAITGGNSWTIGKESGFRTFVAHSATEDGLEQTLTGGICRELAITITTGAVVAATTSWEFQTLESAAEAEPDTTGDASTCASPMNATVAWGGVDLDTFSLAINFSRDLTVGDVDEDGIPRGYSGKTTVDLAGRLVARASEADAATMFEGALTRSLTITIPVGDTTMTIALSACEFVITGRRIVGAGDVEHQIEFVATAGTSATLATVSLVAG